MLFFLVTLVYGIITALSDLEQSVPKALGYTMKEVEAGNPAGHLLIWSFGKKAYCAMLLSENQTETTRLMR